MIFAALFADIYIYRSVICSRFRRLPARIAYIVFALISDGLALSAFLLYSFSAFWASPGVVTVMWLIWIFFLVTFPKLFYTAGGFLDFLVKLAVRRRIVIFRALAVALSVALVVVMICGATTGRSKLRVEEVEICSPRVPVGFDGWRVAQISDVHLGTMCRPEKHIARLAGKIAELSPDMIVNTGDLVNISNLEITPSVEDALSRITAPGGVWSVWGNHDLGFYIRGADSLEIVDNHEGLTTKLSRIGWRTLSDESVWIRRGGDSIVLSGINYPTSRLNGHNNILGGADIPGAFAGIDGDPFSIVLAHTPLQWREITGTGHGDLTLSGHVHAMQFKVRLFGREWSPAMAMYREWSGEYAEKNNILYVNDGIGCVGYPMRIGARPEITIFKFKRCE